MNKKILLLGLAFFLVGCSSEKLETRTEMEPCTDISNLVEVEDSVKEKIIQNYEKNLESLVLSSLEATSSTTASLPSINLVMQTEDTITADYQTDEIYQGITGSLAVGENGMDIDTKVYSYWEDGVYLTYAYDPNEEEWVLEEDSTEWNFDAFVTSSLSDSVSHMYVYQDGYVAEVNPSYFSDLLNINSYTDILSEYVDYTDTKLLLTLDSDYQVVGWYCDRSGIRKEDQTEIHYTVTYTIRSVNGEVDLSGIMDEDFSEES